MTDIIHNVQYNPYYHGDANGVRASGGLRVKEKFVNTQHSYFRDGEQVQVGIMPILEFVVDNTRNEREVWADREEAARKARNEREKKRQKRSEKYRKLAAEYED